MVCHSAPVAERNCTVSLVAGYQEDNFPLSRRSNTCAAAVCEGGRGEDGAILMHLTVYLRRYSRDCLMSKQAFGIKPLENILLPEVGMTVADVRVFFSLIVSVD